MGILGIVLTIATSGLLVCHGFPGKLSEQRYEFQQRSVPVEFEEEYIATTPEDIAQEVMAPDFHQSPKWSQLHPNEVNAFAEFYRQNYNHLVEQYNRMFGLQYGYVMPVQYQLFELPMGYSWQDYFGSQQNYVNQRTEEMSRQLFYKIQNGTIAQQDLEAPSFFVNEAADLLDHAHGHEKTRVQDVVPVQQYQQEIQHEETGASQPFNEADQMEMVLAFNPATGTYEYVYIQKSLDEEKASSEVENVRTSYIQSLPAVEFNNRAVHRDIESSESISESTTQTTEKVTTDYYYGSTYEQQPIYDLQYLESISSSSSPKPNNVMSLVRKKQALSTSSTMTTTTTLKPTTESNVMSMLPHKKQKLDYTNIHQQIRQALDEHMKQQNDTLQEETHFMGMNSLQDHEKLAYDVVDDSPQFKPSQQNSDRSYVTELQPTQSSITTVTQKITTEPSSSRPTPTPGKRIESVSRIVPLYSAPLAPFPAIIHDNNPYYSAPLAPFPGEVHIEPTEVQAVQFSELEDMNQEHAYDDQQIIVPGHDDIHQDTQILDQVPDEFIPSAHDQIAMTHVLGLQREEHQQQIAAVPDLHQQYFEKQQPPEQAYRNPDLGVPQAVVPIPQDQEIAQPPQPVTTTAPANPEQHQKPWLQRQWSKLAKHF